jgi:D-alanyl-lipoteichoic acid acyltransferase DltB (MBOAT superfamily)
MTFNDPGFIFIFVPLAIAGFALFARIGKRSALAFLTFMSFIFYAQWNPKYVVVLVGSILLNYTVSRLMTRAEARERVQHAWLVFGIIANLGLLAYFKYLYPSLNFLVRRGLYQHSFGSIALPLGISFFTFTQIAYLVDLKRGAASRETLLNYSLFVTFFPHLVAGPIIHHKEMMPQFRQTEKYRLDPADVSLGVTWFTMGLFKKVILADGLAGTANDLFSHPGAAGALQAWLGALAFTMQIYFDFSGYSDMALGLARIFSIRFPMNFNSPFKATSVIDFWQRWHITLTRYLMKYVFSPLLVIISRRRQASGKSMSRRARATFGGFVGIVATPLVVTTFLAGVWHGAGFTFIAYGLLHGVYLTINHAWRTFVPPQSRMRNFMSGPVAVGFTFFWIVVSAVSFRASSLHNAGSVYADMFGRHGLGRYWSNVECIVALLVFVIVWLMPNTQELLGEAQQEDLRNWSLVRPTRWEPSMLWWAGTVAVFVISAAYASSGNAFLYFQF